MHINALALVSRINFSSPTFLPFVILLTLVLTFPFTVRISDLYFKRHFLSCCVDHLSYFSVTENAGDGG